jgi:hypothetical protein
MAEEIAQLEKFKSQPWLLFDTVASTSFLVGDTSTPAVGQNTPAISRAGEIDFFQSSNRLAASMPWYTNMDKPAQLSYGMEVWAIYIALLFPKVPGCASFGDGPSLSGASNAVGPSSVQVLSAAIVNFGVLELRLGQEPQCDWPIHKFPQGGGYEGGAGTDSISNAIPAGANVCRLPEPIEMPNNMNLSAKIKLAPQAMATIGDPLAVGAGGPLDPYIAATSGSPISVPYAPYAIQLGLVGRRIKDTQYGQIAG